MLLAAVADSQPGGSNATQSNTAAATTVQPATQVTAVHDDMHDGMHAWQHVFRPEHMLVWSEHMVVQGFRLMTFTAIPTGMGAWEEHTSNRLPQNNVCSSSCSGII